MATHVIYKAKPTATEHLEHVRVMYPHLFAGHVDGAAIVRIGSSDSGAPYTSGKVRVGLRRGGEEEMCSYRNTAQRSVSKGCSDTSCKV